MNDSPAHHLPHLERCLELAAEALADGDDPFGSVLVDADQVVRFADRNRTSGGDQTRHPEFEIARWAAEQLSPSQRAAATVYTSGEHCPMCSAAHAWVGLGDIHYATSTAELVTWLTEWNVAPAPVAALPISAVAPQLVTVGPYPQLTDRVRRLHARRYDIDLG